MNVDIHRTAIFTFLKSAKSKHSLGFGFFSVRTSTTSMRKWRFPLDGLLYIIRELKRIYAENIYFTNLCHEKRALDIPTHVHYNNIFLNFFFQNEKYF
jgi:hypothetical protein